MRAAWTALAACAILLVAVVFVSLLSLLTLRIGVDRWFAPAARLICGAVLKVAGVRVERGETLRALEERTPRILTMNHSSQLDFFIMGSVLPSACTIIMKEELRWHPLLGPGLVAVDALFVDRADPERAQRSMKEASKRIRRRRASVVIAPEGTRSRTGALGPFKMGALHVAFHTGAPIVPLVIRGAADLQPMGCWIPRPGTVTLELLEPIATSDWREGELKGRRDALRELYVAALSGPR